MEIKEACKILKLSYLRESYEDLIEESLSLNLSNEDFLNLFFRKRGRKKEKQQDSKKNKKD